MSVSGIQQQPRVTRVDAEEAVRSGGASRVDQRRSIAQAIVERHAGRSKNSQLAQSVGAYLGAQSKVVKKKWFRLRTTRLTKKNSLQQLV